ncbi:pentatricopeptide repeat-containing protein [Tanacetum coccineum]
MVVSSCAEVKDYVSGVCIHGLVFKVGVLLSNSAAVGSSFVYMYSRCGEVGSARKVFDEMCVRDVVAWTALVIGYVQNGEPENGLRCVSEMFRIGEMDVRPNFRTLEGGFQACGDLEAVSAANSACISAGKTFHGFMIRRNYDQDQMVHNALVSMYCNIGLITYAENVFNNVCILDKEIWNSVYVSVSNSLIDMYTNNGDLKSARKLFCRTDKDIITWNTMISAYTHLGHYDEAFSLFSEMALEGIKPTAATLISMLSACGRLAFSCSGFFRPCNQLALSGNLLEAENLVLSMPTVPDGGLWGALLSACKTHNNAEMGIRIAKRAIECDPDNDGYYITISNLYDSIGMCEEAERMRNFMKERGVEKAVGWSSV